MNTQESTKDVIPLCWKQWATEAIRRELDYGPEAASLWLYQLAQEHSGIETSMFIHELAKARKRMGL